MKITAKQQRFIDEYMIDLNATQAAIRAGYSPATAGVIGCENLSKPNIRAAIDVKMAELAKRTGINQDRVIRELAKMAFVNPLDVINMDQATVKDGISNDDAAAIASVKVKRIPTEEGDIIEREVKLADKTKNLELLGKHLGMFTDKVSVSGEVPVKIVDDIK
jgi:phage terminase small subunit